MNKPVKLPEIRKEAFTKARESLGLSTKDLSGMACLSVRQIEQIENGESSSFYGDQVKFTAAKKVAGLLKLTPEEAFDFAGVVQAAKAVEVEEKVQEETSSSVAEKKTKSGKAIESQEIKEKTEKKDAAPVVAEKVVEPKSEKVSARKISNAAIDYSIKSKSTVSPKKKIFLLAAIGAAVVFSVVNLQPLFFPEPVKQEVVIVQEVTPAPAAEGVKEDKTNAPLVVDPAPATVAVAVSAECPPADAAALNLSLIHI